MNTDNDFENALNDPEYWDDDKWRELASLPEPLSDRKYWDDDHWKELARSLNMASNLSEGQDEARTEGSILITD